MTSKLKSSRDIVGVVVGKLPPPSKLKGSKGRDTAESDDGDDEGDDMSGALQSAMADLRRGMEKGDDELMASAFRDAMDICGSYSDHED